jgi:hypothetical protein
MAVMEKLNHTDVLYTLIHLKQDETTEIAGASVKRLDAGHYFLYEMAHTDKRLYIDEVLQHFGLKTIRQHSAEIHGH